MVQETAVEGYEFNPKKELPREYALPYGTKTYDRYYGPNASDSKQAAALKLFQGRQNLEMEHQVSRNKEHAELSTTYHDMNDGNAEHINRITAGSSSVNRMLITGSHPRSEYDDDESHEDETAELEEHSEQVSHEIKHHAKPLDRELHVYSGTGNGWNLGHLKEEDDVHTPAFTSTSISPKTAYNRGNIHSALTVHSDKHTDFIKNILHFHLPKGYKGGVYAAPVSDFADEHEYLLDKNQKWRVKSITHHTKEIGHGSNFVKPEGETQPKIVTTKQRSRARFITLVPHEENKHVTESTYHDADSTYRGFGVSNTRMNVYADTPRNARRNAYGETIANRSDAALDDAMLQHNRLSEHNSLKGAPEGEISHVINYTGSDSKYLNHALAKRIKFNMLDGEHRALKKLDNGLMSVFKKHAKPLQEEVHAYSGLRDWKPGTKPGDIFHTPAYTSSTIKPSRSRVFTMSNPHPTNPDASEQHVLHFHLPVGYKGGIYVAPHSDHYGEAELLLHKDQKWKHVETKAVNSVRYESNGKRIRRTFVHTVVPHDGKTVSEQTEHTTIPFRNYRNFMDMNHQEKFAEVHDHLTALASADAEHQHARLLTHFGGSEEGNHDYDDEHTSPVVKYTRSGTASFVSVEPHIETKNVQEVLVHEPNRIHDALTGHSARHVIDSKLTSIFVTPHPDVHVDSEAGKALGRYTMSSSAINNALIAGDHRYLAGHKKNNFSDVPQVYKHIKETFKTAKPLPLDHHVYSGLGHWDPLHSTKSGIGDLLHTPAFTSTSHNLEIARRFAPGGNIIHFHLPKGYSKALNMRRFTSMKHENEVLLDHGQTWKIHDITHAKGVFGEAVRIVSVKPHTPEPVTEMATVHDPEMMKIMFGSSKRKGTTKQEEDKWDKHEAFLSTKGPIEQHNKILKTHNSVSISDAKHRKALNDYTSEGSGEINHRLIKIAGGKYHPSAHHHLRPSKKKDAYGYYKQSWGERRPSEVREHTEHLDDMFAKQKKPLTQEGHFYSGTSRWNPVSKTKVGDVVHTPGFTSTTIDPSFAGEFTQTHMIHFKLPTGYDKGLYIGKKSSAGDEGEYLLNRNQKWKYTGTQRISSFNSWAGKTTYQNIHTFEPHTEETIKEAFEHDVTHKAFTNTDSYGAENFWSLKSDKEHTHLKKTNKIPDEYHDAVHYYGYGSTNINTMLISGTLRPNGNIHSKIKNKTYDQKHNWIDPEGVKTHKTLTEMFDKHPTALTREHHVYSGLGIKDPTKYMNGGVFTTPAYTSTSTRPNIAVQHANTHRIDHMWIQDKLNHQDDHIIHFHLPKGYTGGKYIQGRTEYDEAEFLLRPKQKWKVIKKESIKTNIKTKVNRKPAVREHTRHIWTVVPHKDNTFVTEALDHDPKRDLKRASLVGRNPNWMYKHDELVHAKTTERSHRRWDEHQMLSKENSFYNSNIHNYTDGSSHIAYHLIDPSHTDPTDRDYLDEMAHGISSAIKQHSVPLERDHHVYTGISHHIANLDKESVIHTPSFTSTSLDINIAKKFTAAAGPNKEHHVLHFHLPEGYEKGVYLGDHCSYHQEEHEFLLDKGQKWKVHNVKEYHTGMIPSNTPGEHIKYTKLKVVTLKPHDDNVQESTYHSTHPFRNRSHYKENDDGFMKPASEKNKNAGILFDVAHTEMRRDATDQHDRLAKHFETTIPKPKTASDYVKPSHRRTLHLYTSSSDVSREINEGAVKAHNDGHMDNLAPFTSKGITELDRAIDHTKLPLPEEVHAYSGLKWKPELKEGNSFHLPAFTSTSLNPHQSRQYADHYDDKYEGRNSRTDQHVIHFHLPKGYDKGTYIGGISEYPNEHEYILPRNTKWKVIKKKTATMSNAYSYKDKDYRPGSVSQIRTHIYTVVPHHDDK